MKSFSDFCAEYWEELFNSPEFKQLWKEHEEALEALKNSSKPVHASFPRRPKRCRKIGLQSHTWTVPRELVTCKFCKTSLKKWDEAQRLWIVEVPISFGENNK